MKLRLAATMILSICAPIGAHEAPAGGEPDLLVEMSAEVTTLKQGFPVRFHVSIRNDGADPFSYQSPKERLWGRVTLFHQIDGAEGDPRSVGIGGGDPCGIFFGQSTLQPGESLTIEQPWALDRRDGPRKKGDRNDFIPATASLGSHSFWVESRFGDEVTKSTVVKINVIAPEKQEQGAYNFLLNMKDIGNAYYGVMFSPEGLKDLRTLAFDRGSNGYADLARMQLLEWHLFWAMKKDPDSAVVMTGLTPKDCLNRARVLIEMIDTEAYPVPSKVRAAKKRLLEVEKALQSRAKK